EIVPEVSFEIVGLSPKNKTILENDYRGAPAPLHDKGAGLSADTQYLEDIRNRKIFKTSCKTHLISAPFGMMTTPPGLTENLSRSASASYPIVVPAGIYTSLSMMAFLIQQCLPISTFSNRIDSLIST